MTIDTGSADHHVGLIGVTNEQRIPRREEHLRHAQ
jgi:hypothetical protein